jgi:uncharacterized protein YdhG (YjbR/CyaY superfamily)
MAKKTSAAASVPEYLAALPPDVRRAVSALRTLIRAAAPKAVESRSYGILGYKVDGRPFVYCGGFTQHVSLYPVTAAMRRDHAGEIEAFHASKGTLKFPLDRPLPAALIKRLLKTRLKEMQATAKPAALRR